MLLNGMAMLNCHVFIIYQYNIGICVYSSKQIYGDGVALCTFYILNDSYKSIKYIRTRPVCMAGLCVCFIVYRTALQCVKLAV